MGKHCQGGCDCLSPLSLFLVCVYLYKCSDLFIYLFSFFFPRGVCVCFISSSYGVLTIAFVAISLFRITTFSVLISLVNVTNILLIFFSKLLIIIWNRIERPNFLQSSVRILPTAWLALVFAICDLFHSVPANIKTVLNEILKI